MIIALNKMFANLNWSLFLSEYGTLFIITATVFVKIWILSCIAMICTSIVNLGIIPLFFGLLGDWFLASLRVLVLLVFRCLVRVHARLLGPIPRLALHLMIAATLLMLWKLIHVHVFWGLGLPLLVMALVVAWLAVSTYILESCLLRRLMTLVRWGLIGCCANVWPILRLIIILLLLT